jgi:hypothetical protein
MNDVYFSMVKVKGYRGRNFTLKMNPRGQNTVFVMDGNTGKTTIIELLRWCFKYPQSEAIEKFSHMWAHPAHVLDESKKGNMVCEINVHFTAFDEAGQEHFYQFKRVTEGESDPNNKPTTDKITKIYDTLEIDHGKNVYEGDEVYAYISSEFRFDGCADYFCFDGEKAREVMQLSSDSTKIADLLFLVNQRATHPKIEEYKQKLNKLRERVLEEAKAKISDKALELSIGKLKNKLADLRRAENENVELERQIAYHSLAFQQLKDKAKEAQDQITMAKTNELVERSEFETAKQNFANRIIEKRRLIYASGLKWISADVAYSINQIKTQVKEKGKLPEPYREDLIHNCLASGSCEICGRDLDEPAKERVKRLGRQVAPHEVHVFLSSDLLMYPSAFDSEKEYKNIKDLLGEYNKLDNRIKSIKLSKENTQLISDRESLDSQISSMSDKIVDLKHHEEDLDEWINKFKNEVKELRDKNDALKENKIILDKIDESLNIVDSAGDKIKSKTIDIISSVISEGVSSVLGPKFTAKLSETDGLMLGEDGFYGRERGGYSGRLILSYCFAEAMTLIDPIIVDTPSGNIGSQREELARHLIANHRQVVLMCLPTELNDFAPIISPNTINIENLGD